MDTRSMALQVRLSHWAGVMRARNESGQSIRSWCRGNGITEKTYFYWQRKLREATCERVQMGMGAPGFAEVKLAPTPVHPAWPEANRPGQLHVEIDGIQITADSGYPPEKLAVLLREFTRPC